MNLTEIGQSVKFRNGMIIFWILFELSTIILFAFSEINVRLFVLFTALSTLGILTIKLSKKLKLNS